MFFFSNATQWNISGIKNRDSLLNPDGGAVALCTLLEPSTTAPLTVIRIIHKVV